jgi:hypothetical protein
MPAAGSRFVAFWAAHERRATVYGRLLVVTLAFLGLSLVNTYRAWNRPREVVRIGCDGIPELVRVNDAVYSEPDQREIRAFVAQFAIFFMRGDSFSAVNDAVWVAQRMAPALRETFKREAKGTPDRPGSIAVLESLKRRTQIEPSSLEIEVDKKSYPWRATVRGVRQIVGQGPEANHKFELGLELVRASRNELIEGLLVWGVRPKGESLTAAAGSGGVAR